MSKLLGSKMHASAWVRLLVLLGAAMLLAANGFAFAQDDDCESENGRPPESGVEAEDDDSEGETGEIGEAEEYEDEEEGFSGTIGEIEVVEGFDESAVVQVGAEEDEIAPLGEITPYEEFLELPSIESVLERMDPDTRSEIFDLPESVCDKDGRVRIRRTTRIPWRWNCQLIITMKSGGKARGTGFLIGNGTVMTAGHCVHPGRGGNAAFYKQIEVIPGMDGAKRPYGTYFGYSSKNQLRSVIGWKKKGLATHDYGAIILNRGKPGKKIGYFSWAVYSDSTLNNMLVNTAGYPADKPRGTQWFMAGRISKVEPRRLHYMIDTYGGQSGSAVWRRCGSKRFAVGIHAYGGCPNKATRIVKPVSNNMKRWKAMGQ